MLTIARKPSHPTPGPPFEAMGPQLQILRVGISVSASGEPRGAEVVFANRKNLRLR
jgi:hypothetical protein